MNFRRKSESHDPVAHTRSWTCGPTVLVTGEYSRPNGPCQTGRPEARDFWPGPSTARHDLNGSRHGTSPLVLGPMIDLRHAGRSDTAN